MLIWCNFWTKLITDVTLLDRLYYKYVKNLYKAQWNDGIVTFKTWRSKNKLALVVYVKGMIFSMTIHKFLAKVFGYISL